MSTERRPQFYASDDNFNLFRELYEAGNEVTKEINLWLETEKSRDEQEQREGFYRFNDWLHTSGFDRSGLTTAMLDWLQGRR
ncbi:hypothetical protein [Polynucleobacter sp.]|uniref:hypothetical protein n=1 Tax=Polynucleobacter sp. TaxID=2029855 RepID=UPI003F696544